MQQDLSRISLLPCELAAQAWLCSSVSQTLASSRQPSDDTYGTGTAEGITYRKPLPSRSVRGFDLDGWQTNARSELRDSVKRIARKTIDETVAAGLPGGGDE